MIACINFMNLATARATIRTIEVGIRKTSGALRGELMIQYMGESMLVAQFTLSILLIIRTAIMYHQLDYMQSKQLGFDKDQVVVIPLSIEQEVATPMAVQRLPT